jgi:ribosomal protein S18 acetylase RimI-like enzyme
MARAGNVWLAGPATVRPQGIVVATDGVLLGGFIALLAVRPAAAGQGLGARLVGHVADLTFARRRWLFVSCDAGNTGALRFYRRLGFTRVGRLPDLVEVGRVEILLRRGVSVETKGTSR